MGAEFFRFLSFSDSWGLSFSAKKTKNTAHHLHLLVQGHGTVFFFFWGGGLVRLLINTMKTKNQKH